jgi:predicted transcriptional regulator
MTRNELSMARSRAALELHRWGYVAPDIAEVLQISRAQVKNYLTGRTSWPKDPKTRKRYG